MGLATLSLFPLFFPISMVATASQGDQTSAPVSDKVCPVTHPNGRPLPGQRVGRVMDHGNGKLWTHLWPQGVVLIFPEKDGSLRMKFPWWRGIRGRLTITGRRLDAPGPPMKAEISKEYGEIGFQPSTLIFPAEGCWEITGRLDDAELIFVTEVKIQNK
jgi:hypothetical protein